MHSRQVKRKVLSVSITPKFCHSDHIPASRFSSACATLASANSSCSRSCFFIVSISIWDSAVVISELYWYAAGDRCSRRGYRCRATFCSCRVLTKCDTRTLPLQRLGSVCLYASGTLLVHLKPWWRARDARRRGLRNPRRRFYGG